MTSSLQTAIISYTSIDSFIKSQFKPKGEMEKMQALFFRIISAGGQKDSIVEAFQAEVVFSHAKDPKPVIASYGAGPCIIVAGYELEARIGFVAHFSHAGEVEVGKDRIVSKLSNMLGGRAGKFDLSLKGGIIGDETSAATSKSIMKWVSSCVMGIVLTVASSDPLINSAAESKSVLLDTRNGSMRTYSPLEDNPNHYRRLQESDFIWARDSFEKEAKLKCVYPVA